MATEEADIPESTSTTKREYEDKDKGCRQFDKTVYELCPEELKKLEHELEKIPETVESSTNKDTMKEANAIGLISVNAVIPGNVGTVQGESFLNSPTVVKVASEETCSISEHDQVDKVLSCTGEEEPEHRSQQQEDHNSEAVEETRSEENEGIEKTKEIVEKGNDSLDMVDDIETSAQKANTEEPALKVGGEGSKEEKNPDQHDQIIDNQQASMEENPESIKEVIGSKKEEKVGTEMDQDAGSESTKQFSHTIEATSSQNKGALDHTPDPADNLDKVVETVVATSNKEESIDKNISANTTLIEEELAEKNIREEDNETEKPDNVADMKKGSEATRQSENVGDEKYEADAEQIPCDDSMSTLKGNPCIQNDETKLGIGEGPTVDGLPLTLVKDEIQDKNLDSPFVTQKDEMCVQKEEDLMILKEVSKTECIDVKSPVEEHQTEIFEKIAQTNSTENENITDSEIHEEKLDRTLIQQEISMPSKNEGHDMTKASVGEKINEEKFTVQVEENNSSTESVVDEEHLKEDMLEHKESPEHTSLQHDAPKEEEKLDRSFNVISEMEETVSLSESTEVIGVEEENCIKILEENFEIKGKEDKPTDTDEISEHQTLKEKESPLDLDEMIERAEVENPKTNENELDITHSFGEETEQVEGVLLDEVAKAESEQLKEASIISTEACKTTESANIDYASTEEERMKEAVSITSNIDVGKLEKIHSLDYMEKTDVGDAKENVEEEIHKNEETYATAMKSDDTEKGCIAEDTSVKVHSAAGVEKEASEQSSSELSGQSYRTEDDVASKEEEVQDKSRITATEEVTEEQIIEGNIMYVSPDSIEEEDAKDHIVEEDAKDHIVEEDAKDHIAEEDTQDHIIEADNVIDLLPDSVTESRDFQENKKESEKSKEENFKESETTQASESFAHETNQVDESPANIYCASMGKQEERQQKEVEDLSAVEASEKSKEENFKDSETTQASESFAHETNQVDESPAKFYCASMGKQEERQQKEVEDLSAVEASEVKEMDEGKSSAMVTIYEDSFTNQVKAKENDEKEKTEDEEDAKQISQQDEPREKLEQPLHVISKISDAGIANENAEKIICVREERELQNLEETFHKEIKEETGLDTDDAQESGIAEDIKLLPEASEETKESTNLKLNSKESEIKDEKFNMGYKSDSKEKSEGKYARENMAEVYENPMTAAMGKDLEKHIIQKESTFANISPKLIGEEIPKSSEEDEGEDKSNEEVFETTSATGDTREQMMEEVDNFKDQPPKSIEEEILKETSKENEAFEGTSAREDTKEIIEEINNFKDHSTKLIEGEKFKESSKKNEEYEEFKASASSTKNETQTVEEHAIPDLSSLPAEEKINEKSSKECETDAIKIKEETEDSNLERKEQIEATCSSDKTIQSFKDRAETTKELDSLNTKYTLDDKTLQNKSNESLVEHSLFPYLSEEESKNNNFEKEEANTNDSKTVPIADITTELKCSEITEPEGEKQVEDSDSEDKPLATSENEDIIFGSGGTNMKQEETSKLSVNRDKEILTLVDEAEEKVEYAMPDTESEGQREVADKDKLLANKANTIIDETQEKDESQSQNTGSPFNPETPEEMSLQTEDEPTYPKEESNSAFVDMGNNSANEEVMKQGHEKLAMPLELNTEKHLSGSDDVVISEEASEIAQENEIRKADISQDKDSSNLEMEKANSEHEKPLNEASNCIEALGTRTSSENAILEEVESAKNFEGNLNEVVEEEKTSLVLVTEVCRQGSEASDTKENCTLTEETEDEPTLVNEAEEKVECAMPDTESEGQREVADKDELLANKANTIIDETQEKDGSQSQNTVSPFNPETPEEMSLQTEDEPTYPKEESKSAFVDIGNNSANEELMKQGYEELAMPPEPNTEKHLSGSKDVVIEEASEIVHENEICKADILQDKDSSNLEMEKANSEHEKPLNEASKCIEGMGTRSISENAILEEVESAKIFEGNLNEVVEEEKTSLALVTEVCRQGSGASDTKEKCTLTEEVFEKTSPTEDTREQIIEEIDNFKDQSPKSIEEEILKETSKEHKVFEGTSAGEDTKEQIIKEINNFKDQSPEFTEEEKLKESSKENEEYEEFKAPDSSTNKETQTVDEHAISGLSSLPVEEKMIEKSSKECETEAIKIEEEIEDSNLEMKEQIEATSSTDKKIQTFKDRAETTKELDALHIKDKLDDETLPNESNESLVDRSLFPYVSEEENKNDNFEKEEANTSDSKTATMTDITTELKCSNITEPEVEKQVENSDLTSEDKPLATTENEDTIFGSGGTNVKPEETSRLSENKDKEILTLVDEAEEKVEYAMPDTESEGQIEIADKDKLLANKANTRIDESQSQNTGTHFNPETPEEMSLQTEDEPTYPKKESNSDFVDIGNNSANEEVVKQGHEELAMPPEQNTEKHLSGSKDVVISEEASEIAHENEICKADILQDNDSSNLEMENANSEHEKPLNEASKCIEALGTRTISENAILEEVESAKNFEGNLKEVVEEEKKPLVLVTEVCKQGSEASDTKENCTLTEEDLELAGPGKRVECIAESEAEDLINKTIIETSGTKIEEPNNNIQYKNIDFVEQPRVQEGEKEVNEKVELELDDENHNREAHNKTVTETSGTEIEEINNSIRYQNIEFVEQQITGPRVQEGEKEVNKEVELELDNENHKREAQSANEKINYVILTEEDSMETKNVDEKENTTEQIIQEERGTMELHTVSAEDETVNEVFEKTSPTKDTREQIIEEINMNMPFNFVFEGTSAEEDPKEQIIKEINNFKDQSPEFIEEEKLKESSKENEEYEEFKAPDSSTNKETQTVDEHAISDLSSLPVEEKMIEKSSKECETKAIKIEEEIEDSNLEVKEQIEATCSTDKKIQTFKDRAETTEELDALHIKDKLDDETLPNESNESLVDRSLFPYVSEEESKNDNIEKEEANTNDSKTATVTDITTELKCSNITEPEVEKQVENSDLTSEDKPLATTENEDTIFGSGGTNVKPEETSRLSLVDEAEEKVEYAMPDTESEGQREIADKDKLLANKANTIIDESQSQNTGTHFNPETPEEMSLQTEDEPTYPKEKSNSAFVDIGNNSANEEVMKQGHEELAMPPEQNTEKHLSGSKDVVISEEPSEIAHENEICKADILQDKDSSNLEMEKANSEHEKPLNEASKCIEALGTHSISENAILEEVESAKNFEGNLNKVVEEEKTSPALVTEVCRQGSGVSDTKEKCTLTEENLELADPGKRTACLSESEAINKIGIETSGTKIEETNNSIQYQNIEFVEQQITGSRVQEGEKEVKDEVELELDDETQSANEKINYVNLTEEDPMEAKKVDQKENIIEQIIQEDRGTMDLHTVSAGDETVNEVKGYASASIENVKLTDSAEQIETVNLEADDHLIREQDESPLVKASDEAAMERQDIENPVNLTVLVSEESEEKTKEGIIEQGDNIFDKLEAASLTVVTEEKILGEPQPDYKPRRSFNNVAEESNLQLHDSMKFEETSDSDSKIPTIEYEDENKENVTVNEQVTNEIEESKNASHAVSEFKDQSNEEIEEIREAYEAIPESKFQCVEAVTEEEIATNATLPAGNSKEVLQESSCSSIVREQGHLTMISLEKREDRNLNIEDSFGTKMREEACSQKEEPRELKVSEQDFELIELQKDSRNEALEEEGNISFVDSKLKPQEDLSEMYSAGPPSGEKSPILTRPAENISQEASKDEEILDFGGSGNYSDGSATQSLGVEILPELDEKSKEASYITSDRAERALEVASEFQCHNVLISSEETELKEDHLEAAELMAEVNQNEAIESIKNKVSSEKMTEEKEVDEEFHQVSRGQAEIHQEDELMVEEYPGDKKNETLRTTQNRIQNEELSEEIQKASASENITEQTIQEDRAPKDPYLVSVEHEAINESLLDEAGGKNVEETTTKLGNDYQVDETNFKDSIIEAINVLPDSDVEKDDLQTSSTSETAITKKDEETKTNLGVPTATDPATEEAVHENVGENFEETYELHPSEMVHEVDKTYEVKKEIAIAVADNQESLMDDEKHKQTSLGSASDEIGTKETLKLKGQRVSPESVAPSVSVYSQEETPDNNRKNADDEKQNNLVYDKQIAAEMSIAAEKTAINDERDFSEVKEPIESSSRGGDKKPDEAEIHGTIYAIEDEEIQDQTIQNIQMLEKTSDASSEMKTPREVEPNEGTERTVLTSNKDVELVVQDPFPKTLEKTEIEDLKPQIASRVEPELKGVQCDEEKVSDDAIEEKISSSDLLQESTKQTLQLDGSMIEDKEPMPTKEEIQSEKDDTLRAEETKTDEEKDEEDEQKKVDSGSDAPVMVEASRDIDMDVKVSHKKSHNILSGVSSKVKHSISKVKKAITGKSSHTKSHSTKQKKELDDH